MAHTGAVAEGDTPPLPRGGGQRQKKVCEPKISGLFNKFHFLVEESLSDVGEGGGSSGAGLGPRQHPPTHTPCGSSSHGLPNGRTRGPKLLPRWPRRHPDHPPPPPNPRSGPRGSGGAGPLPSPPVVSPCAQVDWVGWRQLTLGADVLDFSGDGAFAAPLAFAWVAVWSEDSRAASGLLLGNFTVQFSDGSAVPWGPVPPPGAGPDRSGVRLLVAAAAPAGGGGRAGDTRVVTGWGLGPDRAVPVPFALLRREAPGASFAVVHELWRGRPGSEVSGFERLQGGACARPVFRVWGPGDWEDFAVLPGNASGACGGAAAAAPVIAGEGAVDAAFAYLRRGAGNGAPRRMAGAGVAAVGRVFAAAPRAAAAEVEWGAGGRNVTVALRVDGAGTWDVAVRAPAAAELWVNGAARDFRVDSGGAIHFQFTAAGASPSATPTPTATATPTATPSATPTLTPTATATPAPTPTGTATATSSATRGDAAAAADPAMEALRRKYVAYYTDTAFNVSVQLDPASCAYVWRGAGYATPTNNRRCGTCCGANDRASPMCAGASAGGALHGITEAEVRARCAADAACIGYSRNVGGSSVWYRPLTQIKSIGAHSDWETYEVWVLTHSPHPPPARRGGGLGGVGTQGSPAGAPVTKLWSLCSSARPG